MSELPHLWSLVKADLRRAQNLLPASAKGQESLARYCEFLEQNELELACDALGELVQDQVVSTEFWIAMRDAATKMEMWHHAIRYEERARRS